MSRPQVPGLLDRLASLTAIRDTELLEYSLLRTLLPLLGVDSCLLYRVNARHEFLRAIRFDHAGVDETRTCMLERLAEVQEAVQPPASLLALFDVVRHTGQPSIQTLSTGSRNVYPLFGNQGINGYLVFDSLQPLARPEDLLVRGILSVYRNYATLLDESQRDKLTGVLNRHSLEQNLDRLLGSIATEQFAHKQASTPPDAPSDPAADPVPGRRKTRPRPHYWLAVIDIDHFKRINDQFGHILGDEVLLSAARLMQGCLRHSDLLYRYGGEEFITITTSADRQGVPQQLERLRRTMAEHRFPQVGQVTISLGYVELDGHFSAHEIISRADQALYQAKKAGRNRLCSHAALLESGVIKPTSYGSVELF